MKTSSAIHNFPLTITEGHLDTFGHVNNARYLEIYEDARWELITANGYGLKEVHERKICPIILSVSLLFKHELKNREKITVTTQCLDYGGKIFKIEQKMNTTHKIYISMF